MLNKKGREQLKKRLQEYPINQTLFRRETWSPEEAVLAYHNISLRIFEEAAQNSDPVFLLQNIIKLLDVEEEVFQNYINYLSAEYRNRIPTQVPLECFINFLLKKEYKIPSHFPEKYQKGATSIGSRGHDTKAASTDYSDADKPAKKRTYDALVLRKSALIELAKVEWFAELKLVENGKREKISRASELIKRPCLQECAIETCIKLGLPPLKMSEDNQAEYNKIKNDNSKLKSYLKNLGKLTPEALIDPSWLSPHAPK